MTLEKNKRYINGANEQGLMVMCMLALLVGVIGGVGAWVFRMLIGFVHNVLFLGQFTFFYDANVHTPVGPWGAGVILVPVVGGLMVTWLVKNFAPEAKGHGVPEVMDAIHYNSGLIRPRVAVVKSIASAISIGSGGAVGREGPIIQIGSAFGSMLGQLIQMTARQRITLIAAGSGAGIAATFNAPLGGLVFAIELLLISVNVGNILLVAIAIVTATHISHLLLGAAPSFNIPALELPTMHMETGWSLFLFLGLGLVMGVVSAVFIRGLYWAEDRFDALPGNYYTRHTLGMLCVGVMMYLLLHFSGHYYIQGVGYATIVDILTTILSEPRFLVLLFLLKLLATCLSLGSGASGGVFSPILFLGATAGAAFGHFALFLIPGLDVGITAFAIAGMAGGIGGTTGAVLTGIVMITEMTLDQNVILPLIITVVTAYTVRKMLMRESVYTLKLFRRGHVVPEGLQAAVFSAKQISELMRPILLVDKTASVPMENDLWLVANDDEIGGVFWTHHQMNSPDSVEAVENYVICDLQTGFVEAVRYMHHKEADIILVSGKPQSNRPEDIVGALTRYDIGSHFGKLTEFL